MSFNKKTIIISFILSIAVMMAACTGQVTVPTATVAPTVEEPTVVPTEPAEEPAVVTEATDAETEAATAETAADAEPEAAVETTDTGAELAPAESTDAEAPAAEAETAPAESADTEAAPAEAADTETEAVPAEPVATEAEVPAETADTEAEVPAEAPAAEDETAAAEPAEAEAETAAVEFVNDGTYAASVDAEGISLDDFVQMTTFNRYQYLNMYNQYAQMYSMYGLPLDSLDEQMVSILGEGGKERLGNEAVDQLTYDKVLRLEAEKAGLKFTDEEVYAQLKTMFGYEDPNPDKEGALGMDSFNVDPIATNGEDDKNQAFRAFAQTILDQNYGGLVSFDFLKDYANNILIDNTMFAAELEQRTFEAEMVNARHILVADEETAKDILARLEAGEEWATLASENSLDTANKDNSGSLGWFGRGEMVSEFEEAAFALEPGQISDPVQTNYGFHIIASDGKEIRPLSGSALEAAQNAAYDEWSLGLRTKHNIQSYPEIWMDAVPMTPEFTVSAPAQETAEATETDETAAETAEEPVEEPAAEAVADIAEETAETEAAAEETAESTEVTETAAEETVESTEVTETAAEETVESTEVTETAAEETVENTEVTETAVEEPAQTEEPVEEEAAAVAAEGSEKTEVIDTDAAGVVEETVAEETVVEAAAEETAVEEISETNASDKESDVVAAVEGNEIKADEFEQMAVFNRYQILSSYNQYAQYYSMFGLPLDDVNAYYENLMGEDGKQELGESTINQMAYFKMLELEAAEMGIEATNKEAVDQMKVNFGYEQQNDEAENSLGLDSFNLDTDISDSDSEEEFRDYIQMDLSVTFNDKISYEFLREYVRHGILENKVVEKLLEGRVFEEEMVNARHILVDEEDTAKELLEKLNAGEEWDALAAEYSKDTGNKDQGGALGWFGRNVMVSEFEDAAFALEPGEISEPIKTNFGWHIIASDGKEIRPMEDEALQAAQNEVYEEWYNGLQEKYNVESYPEVWLPIVPLEPAFEAIVIDPAAQNPDIPTFHIISDEEGSEDDESGIQNTEQTVDNEEAVNESESAENEEDLTIRNTEQDDEFGIKNTEQDSTAYLINNDAENK